MTAVEAPPAGVVGTRLRRREDPALVRAPVAAAPAVTGAIVDALRPLGVHDITIQASPQRVRQAIQTAAANTAQGGTK